MTDSTFLRSYADSIATHFASIIEHGEQNILAAAAAVADQVERGDIVHVYGPGGHSNLAAQEIFFRAGGLVNVSAVLDEGTLLSNGALRSVAMERTANYGRTVIKTLGLGASDLMILVNAYGINAALIDAAICTRETGATLIGVSSVQHAENVPGDHPARHPSRSNLHDLVDIHVDSRVPLGDAILALDAVEDPFSAISTFANAFVLQGIVAEAIAMLADRGFEPTIWRSANAPGGDERNSRFIDDFQHRVEWL